MLAAIDAARYSICLETYIYAAGDIGERFLQALVRARQRGARVRVLVDALGSLTLPSSFWRPLRAVGGEVRYFNPLALNRLGIRNHRKLLVCDERTAVVGGFNIAAEYEGDGVTQGWYDLGVKIGGPLPAQLAASFDEMFARADFQHRRFMRLRKFDAKRTILTPNEQLLLSGPGRGQSPIKHALHADLIRARQTQIIVAYFLPTWKIRRALGGVVRRGGSVELILAGKSDVLLSQLAGQSLYRRFLKVGVRIYEYQPQILHAKLIIVDDIVYVGSANLDQRSLNINYELMLRFEDKTMADEARAQFADRLNYSREITADQWRESRTLWRRLKQRWAYWLLVRIDPYVAQHQWQALPD
jgi:cardiolipin synthase